VLPADSSGHVDADLEAGADRTVRVATDAPEGFSAALNGDELEAAEVDTGAGFAAGSDGGSITVDPGGHRGLWRRSLDQARRNRSRCRRSRDARNERD